MSDKTFRLRVLMPSRNDWSSAAELIRRIDNSIQPTTRVEVILVDDGSDVDSNFAMSQPAFVSVHAVRILRLRRNMGHQRAIAIGLAYSSHDRAFDALAVMDADGEDTAEGLSQLVARYLELDGRYAIFAERSRRSESFVFRIGYQTFRMLHLALTGLSVKVGNFSILPAGHFNALDAMSELWNHYAAAIFRSRLPYRTIPIPRGKRIAGKSKMNLTSLVAHGLSAISVFGDVVGARMLIACFLASIFAILGIFLVAYIRFFTNQGIPGWATFAAGILGILLLQLVTAASTFTIFTLSTRTNLGFIPARDYSWFIDHISDVYTNG